MLMAHPSRELVTGANLEMLHPEKPRTIIMSTWNYSDTARREEIDRIIGDWTRTKPRDELLKLLDGASVPAGGVNDAAAVAARKPAVVRV